MPIRMLIQVSALVRQSFNRPVHIEPQTNWADRDALNPEIDVVSLRRTYEASGVAVVDDFLTQASFLSLSSVVLMVNIVPRNYHWALPLSSMLSHHILRHHHRHHDDHLHLHHYHHHHHHHQ